MDEKEVEQFADAIEADKNSNFAYKKILKKNDKNKKSKFKTKLNDNDLINSIMQELDNHKNIKQPDSQTFVNFNYIPIKPKLKTINDYIKNMNELNKSENKTLKLLKNKNIVNCDKYTINNIFKSNIIVSGFMREMFKYNFYNDIPSEIIQICKYFYKLFTFDIFALLISDGDKKDGYLIQNEYCHLSLFLDEIITNNNVFNIIKVPQVSSDTLKHVITYLEYHKNIEPEPLPCPVRSIHMSQICADIWDAKFMDSFDKKIIFEIILASSNENMKITSLTHLGCAKIATLIKQLDQSEINRIIEEEEKYRREHPNE